MSLEINQLATIEKETDLGGKVLSLSSYQRNFLLSQLLPYDPEVKIGTRLSDGLKEYLLLVTSLEQVLEKLSSQDIKSFDPLVGENACQIRAIKLALILTNYPINYPTLLPRVRLINLKCRAYLNDVANLVKKEASLKALLQKENLEIKLTSNELFLVQSYLLTKVKILKPIKEETPLIKNEYTDTKKIKEISQVGSMFADRLVKKLREKLSEASVRFVQELADHSESEQDLKEMVSERFVVNHRNLKCLPCFWMTRILMEAALAYKTPIVVLAQLKSIDRNYEIEQEVSLYFEPTPSGYQLVSPSALNISTPAIVLLGSTCREFRNLPSISEWTKELTECGPVNLMLAYAANHRQYPNINAPQELIIQKTEDKEFKYYKTKAVEWGCCTKNASRFFLAHAYCNSIGNIIQENSNINDLLFMELKKVKCFSN